MDESEEQVAARRLVRAWSAAGAALVLVFLGYWLANPTTGEALEGYSRTGLVALVTAAPALLLAAVLARVPAESWALLLVPAGVAVLVAGTALFFGYLPVDPVGCRVLADAGVARADCATPAATRGIAMAEAGIVWLLFGALAYGLRRRSGRQAAQR